MNSIWTNLLLLHGHITPRDLAWRADTPTGKARRKVTVRTGRSILASCAAVWPRLIGLR
ncbi:MAG TPA: hypothetical protein VGG00_00695 [Rhodanobacter sp.]|jgi:hypothetical protein